MIRLRTLLVPGLLLALGVPAGGAPGPARAAEPEVSGVRFGQDGRSTRVVVELDRAVEFEASALADPPRLIVDLPEVRWRVLAHPLGNPRGLATAHRYGKFTEGRSRLVVDMARPFRIEWRQLLPPDAGARAFRIVIDTAPEAPEPTRAATPARAVAAVPLPPPPAKPTLPATPPAKPPAGPKLAALDPAAGAERPAGRAPEPAAAPPPPAPESDDRPVIALDPGHGGIDPGALGVTGVVEKDLTLAMARELEAQLLATGRYRVTLTRTDDRYVALRERIHLARSANAALFLSLHADSLGHRSARGASVYTLSETASDDEAAKLAAKENKADILAGADLSHQDPMVASILIDLAQRDTNNRSIELADRLVSELGKVTRLIRNHRRYAGFAVLKSPDTPSVLVELGYLSSPQDARSLSDTRYRQGLARAIIRAVDRYLGVDK